MTSHNKFFNRDEQIDDFFDEESVENSLKDDEEDNSSNNDILINSTDLIALDNINKVSFYKLCKESIFDLLFGNL